MQLGKSLCSTIILPSCPRHHRQKWLCVCFRKAAGCIPLPDSALRGCRSRRKIATKNLCWRQGATHTNLTPAVMLSTVPGKAMWSNTKWSQVTSLLRGFVWVVAHTRASLVSAHQQYGNGGSPPCRPPPPGFHLFLAADRLSQLRCSPGLAEKKRFSSAGSRSSLASPSDSSTCLQHLPAALASCWEIRENTAFLCFLSFFSRCPPSLPLRRWKQQWTSLTSAKACRVQRLRVEKRGFGTEIRKQRQNYLKLNIYVCVCVCVCVCIYTHFFPWHPKR